MTIETYIKDVQAVLDYTIDWTEWLNNGEHIHSVVWTVSTGINNVSTSNTNFAATIWLSGGIAHSSYNVGCRITTNTTPARVDERTFTINVQER
jgi:hypothetical protein